MKNPLLFLLFITIFPLLSQQPGTSHQASYSPNYSGIDSIMLANTYTVDIQEGVLMGTARTFFDKALLHTQFFNLAEEHNVTEVNQLATALFNYLHNDFNFNYLALEQGPVVMQQINQLVQENKLNNIPQYAADYVFAFHMATDQELDFIKQAAETSTDTNPFWGINQEYGAHHVLALLKNEVSVESLPGLEKLLQDVSKLEQKREGNYPYMCCKNKSPEFLQLKEISTTSNPLVNVYIEALLTSERIYAFNRNTSGANPTAYENNFEREVYLKTEFLKNYQVAHEQSGQKPKVFSKLGHWHLMYSLNPGGIPTLGTMLQDLALINQSNSFTLSTYLRNKPGQFRAYKEGSILGYFDERLPDAKFVIIDTKPLRKYYQSKRFRNVIPEHFREEYHSMIFRYDALLFIKDASSGTWNTVYHKSKS